MKGAIQSLINKLTKSSKQILFLLNITKIMLSILVKVLHTLLEA